MPVTAPEPCPRCVFRPCGLEVPGNAACEVRMPDGRLARGWLCGPHQVLLSGAPAFADLKIIMLPAPGDPAGPCAWRVPAEEAFELARELPAPQELTA